VAAPVGVDRTSIVAALGRLVTGRIGRDRRTAIRNQLIGAGLHTTTVETYLGWYIVSGVGTTLLMLWRERFWREWKADSPQEMRRWRNGTWETRPTTADEEADYRSISG
jgi:hypothetical protein